MSRKPRLDEAYTFPTAGRRPVTAKQEPTVLRPYEARNRILLGDFWVYQPFNGKTFIEVAHGPNAGEGAVFPAKDIAKLIGDYYDQEF